MSLEEYQDRPPLKDGLRPLWIAVLAFGVLAVLFGGFAAYSLWPRGGTLAPRMASNTAEQPAANVPYVYLRQPVYYRTAYPVGTIIVDKVQNFLYVVRPNTSALRYGIGTGSECISLTGFFKILRKEEWPGWKQPQQPLADAGNDRMKNPLGARALYLNTDNRIHGTNASHTIGQRTPEGCIRLVNDDVIYFYDRTPLESRVVVLN
jgi:lipoprotein-anchoring transpeptidase ErfK/SrfK